MSRVKYNYLSVLVIDDLCYDDLTGGDSEGNCQEYGRLYDFATAMDIDALCNSNTIENCGATVSTPHTGICPPDWHIPSEAEFEALITAVGGGSAAGTKLRATSGWTRSSWDNNGNGTDDFAFTALPAGHFTGGLFGEIGNGSAWWSASNTSTNSANYLSAHFLEIYVGETYKDISQSIRCVKN